jgi:hypothetical protein
MLIINASGAAGGCFWGYAFVMGCCLVVIRIAVYRNRFSNRFYVCFDSINLFHHFYMIALLLLCRDPLPLYKAENLNRCQRSFSKRIFKLRPCLFA